MSFQREWASAAATIIERYAEFSVVELNEAQIHRAENSFTSSTSAHELFDSLLVALSPVPNAELPVRAKLASPASSLINPFSSAHL
jgi:hypothetical protein